MNILKVLKTIPKELFWSSPPALDSDFTAEDPLALDYLAQQVGLWLFQGFTTRTGRAQNYAIVLYGLSLADKAVRKYGCPGDDETRTRLFERWERFWALATLESRNGQLERGDEDAMRGVRGATRAWFPGSKPLPLDFPLISRQSELGSLGAYLTSLREYGLVFSGSLRVTPSANEILSAFWSEQGDRETAHLYEDYAIQALDFSRSTIDRKSGRITLRGIGEASRLSSLVKRRRTQQQKRLWDVLFLGARDGSTLPLAEQLIIAQKDGVDDAELILESLMAKRWGALPTAVIAKVEVALTFGRLARTLLACFNRAYEYVDQHAWVADAIDVANAAFPPHDVVELRSLCSDVLRTSESKRFRELQFHGPELLKLLTKLSISKPHECLDHLFAFHRGVQRARRGGGAWLRDEQGKIVMQVPGYNGYKSESPFPSFKLNVVRQLLSDLGRLS